VSDNYLESIILQRERLFTSGKHSGQLSIIPEWTSQQVHPKVKNPRATSQTLQASVSMLKVKVHDGGGLMMQRGEMETVSHWFFIHINQMVEQRHISVC